MRNGCTQHSSRLRVYESTWRVSQQRQRRRGRTSARQNQRPALRSIQMRCGSRSSGCFDSNAVTREKAMALAEVLQVPVSRLGLRVRPNVEARSVRFRRLTLEQRFIVDEILSLPPEAYDRLREVIETLRTMPEKRSRGMRA